MDKLRKVPSIAQAILAILHEIGEGAVKSFFPHPYSHLFCNHRKKQSFNSALQRIKSAGLITKDTSGIFRLTKKGDKEAFFAFINAEASKYDLEKKERYKWDGKWRIIFFDVPEKKRAHRDYLRSIIKAVGFKELQKSTWIYPYKIPNFLIEILKEENILPYTRFITTVDVDYDEDLKKLFSL